MIGKILLLEPSTDIGKFFITLEIDDISGLEGLKNENAIVNIEIRKHSPKRSLNANSYFHVLCRKIAQKQDISMEHAKNLLIGFYGVPEIINDEPVYIKTNLPEDAILEFETLHLRFREKDKNDSKSSWYKLYRPSHTYNVEEMNRLIQGTVDMAEHLGIETLTPDERKRLVEAWKPNEKEG